MSIFSPIRLRKRAQEDWLNQEVKMGPNEFSSALRDWSQYQANPNAPQYQELKQNLSGLGKSETGKELKNIAQREVGPVLTGANKINQYWKVPAWRRALGWTFQQPRMTAPETVAFGKSLDALGDMAVHPENRNIPVSAKGLLQDPQGMAARGMASAEMANPKQLVKDVGTALVANPMVGGEIASAGLGGLGTMASRIPGLAAAAPALGAAGSAIGPIATTALMGYDINKMRQMGPGNYFKEMDQYNRNVPNTFGGQTSALLQNMFRPVGSVASVMRHGAGILGDQAKEIGRRVMGKMGPTDQPWQRATARYAEKSPSIFKQIGSTLGF